MLHSSIMVAGCPGGVGLNLTDRHLTDKSFTAFVFSANKSNLIQLWGISEISPSPTQVALQKLRSCVKYYAQKLVCFI